MITVEFYENLYHSLSDYEKYVIFAQDLSSCNTMVIYEGDYVCSKRTF